MYVYGLSSLYHNLMWKKQLHIGMVSIIVWYETSCLTKKPSHNFKRCFYWYYSIPITNR